MYKRRKTITIVAIFLMLASALVYAVWSATSSRADGPPDDPAVTTTAPSDDPCFRQDPECYDMPTTPTDPRDCTDPLVECSCDHLVGGCTGGHPPEGFPSSTVECDNNVFVPRNPDGTWNCPVQEQLPEEVIGSARGDCPDAQVPYVTDVEGHYICLPPADQVSRGGSHPFLTWFDIIDIILRWFTGHD